VSASLLNGSALNAINNRYLDLPGILTFSFRFWRYRVTQASSGNALGSTFSSLTSSVVVVVVVLAGGGADPVRSSTFGATATASAANSSDSSATVAARMVLRLPTLLYMG